MIQTISRKFFLRGWFGEVYVGKRMKMRYFDRFLPAWTENFEVKSRILEVGSEDGCFTEWLSRRWPQARVEGMEVRGAWAAACDQWAHESGRHPQLTFRQGNVLDMTEEGLYDLIVCLDVLGYIEKDQEAVRRMGVALRPGGMLVVHQPNTSYRRFNGAMQYVPPKQAGEITEGHVRHGYTPEEMKALLTTAGLTVSRVAPIHGRFSDLAHRVYNFLEYPAFLRPLSVPFTDLLWFMDWMFPTAHGNTVLAAAVKSTANEHDPKPS